MSLPLTRMQAHPHIYIYTLSLSLQTDGEVSSGSLWTMQSGAVSEPADDSHWPIGRAARVAPEAVLPIMPRGVPTTLAPPAD